MDTLASLTRRATDLVQAIPHPTLRHRQGGAASHAHLKGTWQQIDIPSLPRSSHSLNVVGVSAYIFGGEVKPREPVDNDMHIIKLPSSGAPADYYTVKARPSKSSGSASEATVKPTAGDHESVQDLSEKLKSTNIDVQSDPSSTAHKGEEDADEEDDEEEEEEEEEEDEEDEDEEEEEEEEEEKNNEKDNNNDDAEEKTSKSTTAADVAKKAPTLSNVPSSRVGHATAVIGTRIFMFGGRGGPDMSPIDEGGRVWVFETKTESWSYLDPVKSAEHDKVPPPRSYHAATATREPNLSSATTRSSISHSTTAESSHHAATNLPTSSDTRRPSQTWKEWATQSAAEMPRTARRASQSWKEWAKGDSDRVGTPQYPVVGVVSAEAVDEEDVGFGTFIIHGGCLAEAGARTNDVWAFDVRSRHWHELPSAPGQPRGGALLCVSQSGRLYRFGGFNGKDQEGGQLDVLELTTSDSAQAGVAATNSASSSPTLVAHGTWHSIRHDQAVQRDPEALTPPVPFPAPRSVGALTSVLLGGGREYLVLMLGESDASDKGHEGAGNFLSDVWTFHVPPRGMASAAAVEDAVMGALGRKTSEGYWLPVETSTFDRDEDEPERNEVHPGARGWFGSAAMGEVEGNGILIWGGVNAQNQRLGDGFIFRLG